MNPRKLSLIIGMLMVLLLILPLISCSGYKSNDPGDDGGNSTSSAITIANSAFSPRTTTIKVGTKVTWTNNDSFAHTVTSDDGAFESSGNLANSQRHQVTFSAAGTFPYHCSIHPSMTATITVTP